MELEITFYFHEVAGAIECTSILNENIFGVGSTELEAQEDHIKKYNEWSAQVKENAIAILNKKGAVYAIRDLKLTLIN